LRSQMGKAGGVPRPVRSYRWRQLSIANTEDPRSLSLWRSRTRISQNSVLIGMKAAALNPADHVLQALPIKSYSHFQVNL